MIEQRQGRRYQIVETLGKGGFGTVYHAQMWGAGGFSKDVALKVLNADRQDEQYLRRLRDEARMLGMIRHQGIIRVDDLICIQGRWIVVMEYVEGATLARLQKEPLPTRIALEIIGQIADALHIAHTSLGRDGRPLTLLHRDIKPSNIQLTPAGEVKLLDFGVARAEFSEREATTRNICFGTDRYMAPERFDGLDSPAADVYSLGVVLCELLTQERWPRTSANLLRHQTHCQKILASLRRALHGQEACDEIISLSTQLLAHHPAERPSAQALEQRIATIQSRISGVRLRDWAAPQVEQAIQARRARVKAGKLAGVALVVGDDPAQLDGAPTPLPSAAIEPVAPSTEHLSPPPAARGATLMGLLILCVLIGGALTLLAPNHPPPPSVPAAAPPTPPESLGEVIVTGASSVVLISKEHRLEPGRVPPGRYQVVVRFEGDTEWTVGTIDVVANGVVRLICNPVFAQCEIQ